ncbi:hypothetical protein CN918_32105 [Priestia megaterium]|nr:hypothetical protein CN918_32105 [Priestia megaterium]
MVLQRTREELLLERHAIFDDTRFYRYSLSRVWDSSKEKVVFIMLNPSTADEQVEDNTLNKCIRYAQRFGYGSLEVVNLFAMITTKPEKLMTVTKEVAIGPQNAVYVDKALRSAAMTIAAWGANANIHKRHLDIPEMFSTYSLLRLGVSTRDGHPRHPLYLKYDIELMEHLPARATQSNRLKTIIKDSYTSRNKKDAL